MRLPSVLGLALRPDLYKNLRHPIEVQAPGSALARTGSGTPPHLPPGKKSLRSELMAVESPWISTVLNEFGKIQRWACKHFRREAGRV